MKWLFLVHQVQTPNSRERVKVWRSTKKVGAVLYRNSVYVLPYSKERLEDFHWLCQQIRDSQGEASVFICESTDEAENRLLQLLFSAAREPEYTRILETLAKLAGRIGKPHAEKKIPPDVTQSFSKELKGIEASLAETTRIDFFNHPLNRKAKDMVARVRTQLENSSREQSLSVKLPRHDPKKFQGKTWATRENIHIDRLCSAWLIKRFIDPKAKFVFAPEAKLPENSIKFDVFGVEFGHHAEDCTFETLLKTFRINDKALTSIAQIVHDIDMKDNKFGRDEAPGIDAVVRSLSDSLNDDHKTLGIGSVMLDALYDRVRSK